MPNKNVSLINEKIGIFIREAGICHSKIYQIGYIKRSNNPKQHHPLTND
jgi:hypothetical protein